MTGAAISPSSSIADRSDWSSRVATTEKCSAPSVNSMPALSQLPPSSPRPARPPVEAAVVGGCDFEAEVVGRGRGKEVAVGMAEAIEHVVPEARVLARCARSAQRRASGGAVARCARTSRQSWASLLLKACGGPCAPRDRNRSHRCAFCAGSAAFAPARHSRRRPDAPTFSTPLRDSGEADKASP